MGFGFGVVVKDFKADSRLPTLEKTLLSVVAEGSRHHPETLGTGAMSVGDNDKAKLSASLHSSADFPQHPGEDAVASHSLQCSSKLRV